ncbi:MAG: MmcQ/YjbR family DNA-binding protein [Anaerolineaceae bacterium]|nr:MmcQ/YjbR family DNA-binding protein [Anaerolineaceae bacterium]
MNYEDLCEYLLRHPGTVKEHLLETDTPAFKVKDKVYAIVAWQKIPMRITLKLKLQRSNHYQALYSSINPGNINNQSQWINIPVDHTIPLPTILDIIDESYELALKSLKKSVRDKLQMDVA